MVDSGLGARHASTLDGVLLAPGKMPAVTIVLDEQAASTPAWQAATWLLAELVGRGDGHASTLTVVCGHTRALLALPGVATGANLGEALVARSGAIGGVPAALASSPSVGSIVVRVGPGGAETPFDLEVIADDWAGGVRAPGEAAHPGDDAPRLMLGAFIGACHAAAALFRAARFPEPVPAGVWHDSWELRCAPLAEGESSAGPPTAPLDLELLALAGMGAVANAFVTAALTHPDAIGTLRAADFDEIDLTNLNRCLLFVRDNLGQLKADVASSAANLIGAPDVRLEVVADRAEKVFTRDPVEILVSAVDTNRAREAINRLLARRVLAGSTWRLRTQTNTFAEPGPCLRCFNAPEPVEPDREVKARVLAASDEEVATMATEAKTSPQELRAWAETTVCGELDSTVLPVLRQDGPTTFSVGFVSVLSGVLLTAAAIRSQLEPWPGPTTARAQLTRPHVRTQASQPAPADPDCPACGPGGSMRDVWRSVWRSEE